MFTFLVILFCVTVVLLVVVTSMQPDYPSLSKFELERRSALSDNSAKHQLHRYELLGEIVSLQRVISALLMVAIVFLGVAAFGPVIGSVSAVAVALLYGAVARPKPIRKVAQKLYKILEPGLLRFATRYSLLFTFIRFQPDAQVDVIRSIDSRQELQHLVSESSGVLTQDEKKLITNSLEFGDRRVDAVMTPRTMISSISKSEFLGPLTLDELHKTGHSRLPVVDQDIDHIVGTLHLQDLLSLEIKRSVTAEKAMEPRVFYIRNDQTLHHALAAFLRTHHHLFVVVNEYRETVGLLTIEDVIEALLGRKIVDEYDGHEDLRVVALRNPNENNDPKNREDV